MDDYKNLSTKELKYILKQCGIKGCSKMNRKQIVELIDSNKETLEGAGFFDFLKQAGTFISKGVSKAIELPKKAIQRVFSPSKELNNISKKTLKEYGHFPIVRLQIYRTPLSGMINTLLSAVSFGKIDELKKKYGYDKFYHLALVATVKTHKGEKNIIIEKNEAPNISTKYETSELTEVMTLPPLTKRISLQQLIDFTIQKVGENFFRYSAFTTNCQRFIMDILESNQIPTTEAKDFILQSMEELAKELPDYVKGTAQFITDLGGTVSKLTGKGEERLIGGKGDLDFTFGEYMNNTTGLIDPKTSINNWFKTTFEQPSDVLISGLVRGNLSTLLLYPNQIVKPLYGKTPLTKDDIKDISKLIGVSPTYDFKKLVGHTLSFITKTYELSQNEFELGVSILTRFLKDSIASSTRTATETSLEGHTKYLSDYMLAPYMFGIELYPYIKPFNSSKYRPDPTRLSVITGAGIFELTKFNDLIGQGINTKKYEDFRNKLISIRPVSRVDNFVLKLFLYECDYNYFDMKRKTLDPRFNMTSDFKTLSTQAKLFYENSKYAYDLTLNQIATANYYANKNLKKFATEGLEEIYQRLNQVYLPPYLQPKAEPAKAEEAPRLRPKAEEFIPEEDAQPAPEEDAQPAPEEFIPEEVPPAPEISEEDNPFIADLPLPLDEPPKPPIPTTINPFVDLPSLFPTDSPPLKVVPELTEEPEASKVPDKPLTKTQLKKIEADRKKALKEAQKERDKALSEAKKAQAKPEEKKEEPKKEEPKKKEEKKPEEKKEKQKSKKEIEREKKIAQEKEEEAFLREAMKKAKAEVDEAEKKKKEAEKIAKQKEDEMKKLLKKQEEQFISTAKEFEEEGKTIFDNAISNYNDLPDDEVKENLLIEIKKPIFNSKEYKELNDKLNDSSSWKLRQVIDGYITSKIKDKEPTEEEIENIQSTLKLIVKGFDEARLWMQAFSQVYYIPEEVFTISKLLDKDELDKLFSIGFSLAKLEKTQGKLNQEKTEILGEDALKLLKKAKLSAIARKELDEKYSKVETTDDDDEELDSKSLIKKAKADAILMVLETKNKVSKQIEEFDKLDKETQKKIDKMVNYWLDTKGEDNKGESYSEKIKKTFNKDIDTADYIFKKAIATFYEMYTDNPEDKKLIEDLNNYTNKFIIAREILDELGRIKRKELKISELTEKQQKALFELVNLDKLFKQDKITEMEFGTFLNETTNLLYPKKGRGLSGGNLPELYRALRQSQDIRARRQMIYDRNPTPQNLQALRDADINVRADELAIQRFINRPTGGDISEDRIKLKQIDDEIEKLKKEAYQNSQKLRRGEIKTLNFNATKKKIDERRASLEEEKRQLQGQLTSQEESSNVLPDPSTSLELNLLATPEQIQRGEYYDYKNQKYYAPKTQKDIKDYKEYQRIVRVNLLIKKLEQYYKQFGGIRGFQNQQRGAQLGSMVATLNFAEQQEDGELMGATMNSLVEYFTTFAYLVPDPSVPPATNTDDFELAFSHINNEEIRDQLLNVLNEYQEAGYIGTFWMDKRAIREAERQRAYQKWRDEHPFDAFVSGIGTGFLSFIQNSFIQPLSNLVKNILEVIPLPKSLMFLRTGAQSFAGFSEQIRKTIEASKMMSNEGVMSFTENLAGSLNPFKGITTGLQMASLGSDIGRALTGTGRRYDPISLARNQIKDLPF